MRYRRLVTPESTAKRIAEGRGGGEGANYQPWHFIQDFPSQGRVHRIKGWIHGRVHHLFSDLELHIFLAYEWSRYSIVDIREQYPLLPVEETLAIAEDLGIHHPVDRRTKYPIVLTTDFFLTKKSYSNTSYIARTAKYLVDLSKQRTLEKLEIERRYWERRNISWGIVTEQALPTVLIHNVKWLHPYFHLMDLYPMTKQVINETTLRLTEIITKSRVPLREAAGLCDAEIGFKHGDSLAVCRHLIANGYWRADMNKPLHLAEPFMLLNQPKEAMYCEEMVA
jgi:hypothetical protein